MRVVKGKVSSCELSVSSPRAALEKHPKGETVQFVLGTWKGRGGCGRSHGRSGLRSWCGNGKMTWPLGALNQLDEQVLPAAVA